jgi:hypothetical protein
MRSVEWPIAGASNRQLSRLDASILLLIVGLVVVSLAVWYSTGFPGVEDARALDIAINVAAAFIGAGVAVLAWIRWRDSGEPVALYESSAFVALTVINVLMISIVIVGREADSGWPRITRGRHRSTSGPWSAPRPRSSWSWELRAACDATCRRSRRRSSWSPRR